MKQFAGHRKLAAVGAAFVGAALSTLGGPAAAGDQTVRFEGPQGAPHISLIGDSTLSGVRWYADYGALERFSFVFSAESCRRTIDDSCISREGYRSENVIGAIRSLDGELGELLVVMSGYNDPPRSIDAAIDRVLAEARAGGVPAVMWLTLRTNGVDYSDPQEQTSVDTFRAYNEALIEAAHASDGYLQVADWATHSDGARQWFEYDGVHLTAAGVDALTTFVADSADAVLAGDAITPSEPPWTVLVPGAEGDVVRAVQERLLTEGIELPGGVDGVFGGDTMGAVAEYQRRTDGLQVTGAVDVSTARMLGVYGADSGAPTTAAPAMSAANGANPVASPSGAATPGPVTVPIEQSDAGRAGWPSALAVVIVACGVLVVARRRYVVARRAERRWARVHPATAPLQSVADLRRAGQLAARQSGHAEEPIAQ